MRPIVIAVAITGSVPRKRDNRAVPITPQEQIESTHEAFEAGATLVHIHVRNDDETSSSDPDRFALVQEGVKRHCPGMIIQFSTGGRGRDPSARGSSLYLRPDMASLSTGSVKRCEERHGHDESRFHGHGACNGRNFMSFAPDRPAMPARRAALAFGSGLRADR